VREWRGRGQIFQVVLESPDRTFSGLESLMAFYIPIPDNRYYFSAKADITDLSGDDV
jgi:hypothetical protein